MAAIPNGSNGRGMHRVAESERLSGELGLAAVPGDRPAAYAAAIVVGAVTDDDIIDLARRGLMVRPFREIDPSLAALVLGPAFGMREAQRESQPNTRESPRTIATSTEPASQGTPERTYDGEFASQLCAKLDPIVPSGPVRDFFHLAARKTRQKLSVMQAAEAIGLERQKLVALLQEARMPNADDVLRLCRLAHAAWLLDRTPRRSVKQVAKALLFASGATLGNSLHQTVGVRPRALVKSGGFNLLVAHLRRAVQAGTGTAIPAASAKSTTTTA